jgi:hypothetical protein
MPVRYSARLTALVLLGGFVWLALLIVLTLNDYVSRRWPMSPGRVIERAAPGSAPRGSDSGGSCSAPPSAPWAHGRTCDPLLDVITVSTWQPWS